MKKKFSIGFLTPYPSVLKHDWYRDLIYQKVGIPNLAGYLQRAGFSDIAQYDFNNQVLQAYARSPEKVRLMLYADEAAVQRYLESDEPAIRRQTEFFLDELGVEKKDMFGLSLAGFLGDTAEIALGARLAMCLAKALKLRYPGCTVALGGMQNMGIEFLDEEYFKLMQACPHIDYAVSGEAHLAMLAICRSVEAGHPFRAGKLGPFVTRKVGGGLLIKMQAKEDPTAAFMRYFRPLPEAEVRDTKVPYGYPAYDPASSRAYAYSGDQVRRFYHLPRLPAPAAARGLNYLTLQVSFSEGCPFNCYFCGNATTEFYSLAIDDAIEILKRLRGELDCRHFLFYNPNFNPSYKYAATFLEKLIKADLGLLWADCFNLRNMDRNLIAMMREAGCMKVIAGVEYPTRRMLKYINKGVTVEQVNRNLEDLHKAGIWNHVLLITGMPTETWDDVAELDAWLKASKDFINAYTVGSFHMVEGSVFFREPERFGFKIKSAMQLYCQSEFEEKNGLGWQEKQRQNRQTNLHVRNYIDELKGSRKPTASRMDDSHLLMYLYRTLGHAGKRRIEELYEAAYTVNPHIASAYGRLRAGLRPAGDLGRALRGCGLAADLHPVRNESVGFTLSGCGAVADGILMARNEQILINPADNRLHGDFFVLEAAISGPQERLNALVSGLEGRLSMESADAGSGLAAVRLTLPEGYVLYKLSPAPARPAFTYKSFARGFPDSLAKKLGALLLAAASPGAAASAASGTAAVRKMLPQILRRAENAGG